VSRNDFCKWVSTYMCPEFTWQSAPFVVMKPSSKKKSQPIRSEGLGPGAAEALDVMVVNRKPASIGEAGEGECWLIAGSSKL
jgi:hypothetical protein